MTFLITQRLNASLLLLPSFWFDIFISLDALSIKSVKERAPLSTPCIRSFLFVFVFKFNKINSYHRFQSHRWDCAKKKGDWTVSWNLFQMNELHTFVSFYRTCVFTWMSRCCIANWSTINGIKYWIVNSSVTGAIVRYCTHAHFQFQWKRSVSARVSTHNITVKKKLS